MIEYTSDLTNISAEMLAGFFVGWPNAPSKSTHLKILRGSYCVWLAIDAEINAVVGFASAISDGVLCAYIPLVEVLPAYQHQGIGAALVKRMLASLKDFYMVDLLCDEERQSFYAEAGMQKAVGMFVRNFERQNGE